MRDPNDNLDRIYANYSRQPEELRKTFNNFNSYTEKTYSAFKEIIGEHPNMSGKSAMVIMARNQASHLITMARDPEKSYNEILYGITAVICPMFQMMYDRFTRETIEHMMAEEGVSDGDTGDA